MPAAAAKRHASRAMTDAASDNERPLIAQLMELRSRLLRGEAGLL